MAHPQQVEFCTSVRNKLPRYFAKRVVLDIGSLDINGNNQYLFDDCLYIGVDLLAGRNVDIASTAHALQLPDASLDVVISTECFEHDQYYERSLRNIVRMLKPGGLFLFSCATTGRPEHGTRRTTPADAPFTMSFDGWGDYYKNLESSDIAQALPLEEIFAEYEFSSNDITHDLYFWGVKRGVLEDRQDYSFLIAQQGLREQLRAREAFIQNLMHSLGERDRQVTELTASVREQAVGMTELQVRYSAAERALVEKSHQVEALLDSTSWRVTWPLRAIKDMSRASGGDWFRKGRAVMRYVARGEFRALAQRIRTYNRESALTTVETSAERGGSAKWIVLTTQHTMFIASGVLRRLEALGLEGRIETSLPERYAGEWVVALCPQMYKQLPPGNRRICFQLEQSVSSRWFKKSYFDVLEQSLGVMDYSLRNLDYMAQHGVVYPHVYYLPIGGATAYRPDITVEGKCYDVLFYGDAQSSERRNRMLKALAEQFQVKIIGDLFGDALIAEVRKARLVVNIHYYDNALLEMPRIQECLSLGVPVVSESTVDAQEYPELEHVVRFFDEGSVAGMLEAVNAMLAHLPSSEMIEASVRTSERRFNAHFDRVLLGLGFLPASHEGALHVPDAGACGRFMLSLPETVDRRRIAEASVPAGFQMVNGVRRRPGWIGCALSYQALARHGIAQGLSRLEVMEDDVLLPADFPESLALVNRFLDTRQGDWDIFAGVIAVLHPAVRVLAHVQFEGREFVCIDRMTSMVFNIYGPSAMQLLATWDPLNKDAETNTIDKWIESKSDLKIWVMLPFMVGHREEVNSTLWGFQNTAYSALIAHAQASLQSLVGRYDEARRSNALQ